VTGCCQVTTTLPDRAAADDLAAHIIDERLAACAQVLGPVSSTYHWEGRTERAAEWYCHLKTTVERLPALQARIRELHPYEVPEIVAVPIMWADADYLRWIQDTLK
jgi:periplasmic divalent cation tolerance protein